MAGVAALGLFATMFLPWYSTSAPVRAVVNGRLQVATASGTKSALFVFSFVEAAVLLVCVGVLALLLARGERRAFHLPGGDGPVLTLAGAWASLLVVWRLFDKPDLGRGVSVGTHWGIFVALGAAGMLAYAGNRVRAAHRPEPPLPRAREREPAADRHSNREVHLPDERPHLADTEVLGAERARRGPGDGDHVGGDSTPA